MARPARNTAGATISRARLLSVAATLVCLSSVWGTEKARGQEYPYKRPLEQRDFEMISLPGVGDRQNTWIWSMQWYQDKLYVGTNRAWHCVEVAGFARVPIVNWFYKYPPRDPDMACTPDPRNLPLQAEIWRWSPQTDLWERVYQAPLVEIPDEPGYWTGRDVGYRDMVIYEEPDGTEALYVMGVTQNSIFPNFPPPRILRTVDGEHFEAVPHDHGTFMGDLNQDNYHSSFRAPSVYHGRLVLETGTVQGNGELIESAAPWEGNDAYRMVLPADTRVYITLEFNDFLYIGLQNPNGFDLLKTRAEGDPPYALTRVIQGGGFAQHVNFKTSGTILYMFEHAGMLFCGTDKPAELIRVFPDDTWDLVVGMPRESLVGWKHPLSGYNQGFNSTTNHHIWRMGSYQGWLYMGTADASTTNFKDTPLQPLLEPYMGFDLFATKTGYYMYELSRNGFDNMFNLGIRAFSTTPYGLYFGAANNWYGCEIYWGKHRDIEETDITAVSAVPAAAGASPSARTPLRTRTAPHVPDRLEVEILGDQALLSWEGSPWEGARAQVLRRRAGSATRIEPFRETTATDRDYVIVDLPPDGVTDTYKIRYRDAWGRSSPSSNIVSVPGSAPPVTCASLSERIVRTAGTAAPGFEEHAARIVLLLRELDAAGEERDEVASPLRRLRAAFRELERSGLTGGAVEDVSVRLYKLLRRTELARRGLLPLRAVTAGTASLPALIPEPASPDGG